MLCELLSKHPLERFNHDLVLIRRHRTLPLLLFFRMALSSRTHGVIFNGVRTIEVQRLLAVPGNLKVVRKPRELAKGVWEEYATGLCRALPDPLEELGSESVGR